MIGLIGLIGFNYLKSAYLHLAKNFKIQNASYLFFVLDVYTAMRYNYHMDCNFYSKKYKVNVVSFFRGKGYQLYFDIKCPSCGAIHTRPTNKVYRTKGYCTICFKRSKKDIKYFSAKYKVNCVGFRYQGGKNQTVILDIRCDMCKDIFSRPTSKAKKICSKCAREKISQHQRLDVKGMNLPSKYISGYVNWQTECKWKCKCGHIFSRTLKDMIKKGATGLCSFCSKDIISKKISMNNHEVYLKQLKDIRPEISLVGEFKGYLKKTEHKCQCGNIWEAKPNNIIHSQDTCGCRRSYIEEVVRDIFQDIFSDTFPRARPDFLRYQGKNKRFNLELDGYNKKLKIAFEVNGPSHYRDIYGGDLDHTIRKDEHKKKICQKLKIKLYTIRVGKGYRISKIDKKELYKEIKAKLKYRRNFTIFQG